jgi:hypothetical protein
LDGSFATLIETVIVLEIINMSSLNHLSRSNSVLTEQQLARIIGGIAPPLPPLWPLPPEPPEPTQRFFHAPLLTNPYWPLDPPPKVIEV